jgi:hypothetical protein
MSGVNLRVIATLLLSLEIDVGPFAPLLTNTSYVVHVLNASEKGCNLVKFSILWVVDKRSAINSIFRMENVRAWRIVDDNRLAQVAVNSERSLT